MADEVRVEVELFLNGSAVPAAMTFDARALATVARALGRDDPDPPSPYMTVGEAAIYLRCKRQRIDDLLSQRRLTRVKDGARTLIKRAEIEEYLRLTSRSSVRRNGASNAR